MDIVKVFGINVKRYRKTLDISQEAFAENEMAGWHHGLDGHEFE